MKNYLIESMSSYMGKLEEARNPENDKINQPIKNESLTLKEDINTPFIKIYKASPDIKSALNTIYNSDDVSDDWDFPIEELDYLLEEHPGESFVLKDDRLYEFYPEEMNESLSLKEGVDWNSFDELCEWCKNISGDVGWNTWNYAYMFLNYLYPYLNSNQINQAKADIESDVNNDDINESLSLKEDVNAKWTQALLLKLLRKEIQETAENFPWDEGSRFKITNLEAHNDRLTLFASCENPKVSEKDKDAIKALEDCIINAFTDCGIKLSRDSITVRDLRDVGMTSRGDFCITLQF